MNKNKIHLIIVYLIIFILISFILLSNRNIIINNRTMKLKNIDETTEVANLNNAINALEASHTEYSNYIQTSKANLATAITNAGVTTNELDDFETMITNISKILATKTNDATAEVSEILSGKTAYVNGNKVTGTMINNGAVNPSAINAGESYTIPEGYHNGSGKVTVNSLESQTQATASADNITEGKTAWINGKLITGNGADNKVGYLGNNFVLTNVGTGNTYTASKEEKILVVASVLYIQNGGNWQYPGVTIKKNGTTLSNQSIALNLDSIFGNYGMRAQSIVVFNLVSLSAGDTLNLSFTNSSSNGVRLYRLEQ